MALDLIEEKVKSAVAASQRSRRVMFFSQVFGLVVLVVCFNTELTHWTRDRRHIVLDAEALFLCQAPPSDVVYQVQPTRAGGSSESGGHVVWRPVSYPENTVQPANLSRCDQPDQHDRLSCRVQRWVNVCQSDALVRSTGIPRERLTRAAHFVLVKRLSSADLAAEISRIDTIERDNAYTIPVPLTGLRIDVNDFGIFGGVVHLSVLLWLLIAIGRERDTLSALAEEKAALEAAVAHNFFGNLPRSDANTLRPKGEVMGKMYDWVFGRASYRVLGVRIVFAVTTGLVSVFVLRNSAWPGRCLAAGGLGAGILFLIGYKAFKGGTSDGRGHGAPLRAFVSGVAGVLTIILPMITLGMLASFDQQDAEIFCLIYPRIPMLVLIEEVMFALNAVITGLILTYFLLPDPFLPNGRSQT